MVTTITIQFKKSKSLCTCRSLGKNTACYSTWQHVWNCTNHLRRHWGHVMLKRSGSIVDRTNNAGKNYSDFRATKIMGTNKFLCCMILFWAFAENKHWPIMVSLYMMLLSDVKQNSTWVVSVLPTANTTIINFTTTSPHHHNITTATDTPTQPITSSMQPIHLM